MKQYLYKEFCDENPYGTEITEIYKSRDAAVARLKERVSEAYEMPFENIPGNIGLEETDTFREDYVSIDNGDGAVSYWIVEEKDVGNDDHPGMKKMYSVYGVNYEDEGLTGCAVFPLHKDAVEYVEGIFAEIFRNTCPELEGFSDKEVLTKKEEEEEYQYNYDTDCYKNSYLEYCIEPVYIGNASFEKAGTSSNSKPAQGLEIGRMLTLSTGHISKKTADLLNEVAEAYTELSLPVVYTKGEYGYMVHINEEHSGEWTEDKELIADTPSDLYECMRLAIANDCDWLVFDRDAGIVKGLQVFDW